MKPFRWPPDKNERLRTARGVTFEHMVIAIESGGLLDLVEHRNRTRYPRQQVFVVLHEGYVYLVPFIEEEDHYFLKTIIPSRKAKRDYLKDKDAES
jgi:uncharacterized DUF497 family protein